MVTLSCMLNESSQANVVRPLDHPHPPPLPSTHYHHACFIVSNGRASIDAFHFYLTYANVNVIKIVSNLFN